MQRLRCWAAETTGGQVLVIFALLIVVLLGATAFTVDFGRQLAERRHIQNAADAAALAGCRSLTEGDSDATAATNARAMALINLEGSPASGRARIASDLAREYEDGHLGDPAYLTSGVIVSGNSVRVAISSALDTTFGRVLGISELGTSARARCQLQGSPAVPLVASRYANPPGPGGGFVDRMATEATSGNGVMTPSDPTGYDEPNRVAASEDYPGPVFELYGTNSKANNASDFRGFVSLDVRDFEDPTARDYYNGVTSDDSEQTLKDIEGAYFAEGYDGPPLPAVSDPATGATQLGVLTGHDTSFVVQEFDKAYEDGDRLLLGVYDGTVREVPDFSISPPSSAIVIPGTTSTPVDGPSFSVSRNQNFSAQVALSLRGDVDASDPSYDLVPDPSVNPPAPGDMSEPPLWSSTTIAPDKNGTTVTMPGLQSNAVPAGIYTVWLEGESNGTPVQRRRYPVAVQVGSAVRDFSLKNSILTGSTDTVSGTVSLQVYVSTRNSGSSQWNTTNPVTLSWDSGSFTDCSLHPVSLGTGSITFDTTSVVPSSSGNGAPATLTVNTGTLTAGCYAFTLRGTGTNGDGQPVTHLRTVTFNVATDASTGQYIDLIGYGVFQIDHSDANSIYARAVSGIFADPSALELRRAQEPRLVPWT